jgi:hypothetical protein
MADFIPRSDAELAIWLGNHQTQIAAVGTTVGLLPADITAISDACNRTFGKINDVEAEKQVLQQKVSEKDAAKKEDLALIRGFVKRMKAHAAYTDAIGQQLGIIGTADDMDEELVKPKLTGDAFPGYVRLKFTKKGLDGVNIYTRLKGQSQWNFLARDTNSPYDDNRPLLQAGVPETREYMGIGVIADTEVGQASDIVSVVFGG